MSSIEIIEILYSLEGGAFMAMLDTHLQITPPASLLSHMYYGVINKQS